MDESPRYCLQHGFGFRCHAREHPHLYRRHGRTLVGWEAENGRHPMNFGAWPELLVLDVEGNGTNPPDLVEVAALPVRDGRPDKTTAGAWLTRPNRPVTPFATRVHGLSNHDLANKPGWDEIADQVRTFMGSAWICVHNAHTDYRVLRAHLPGWEPHRT
ncbi:3'-5' exonuclease [Streptomyces sp. CA-106110]|uniref:3'-5' exonuclease n=1 Tax=Streptomyces sp. CA-106110 TaxID=3240044 RepID=UPI003D91915A